MRNLCLAILCSIFLVGCSGGAPADGSVAVSGKVTLQGQPLQVAGREMGVGLVEVKFYPLDATGKISEQNFQAGVDAQGAFNVPGPSNRGLPPGKYRVVVRQWDPYPEVDKLQGKFDETNSKITQEISNQPKKIELELSSVPQ
jgi:hypothetical protein